MLGGQTADAEPAQRQACDIAFLPASLRGLGLMGAQRRLSAVYRSSRPVARPRRQASRPPRLQACISRATDGTSGLAGKRVYEQRRRKRRAASAHGWQRHAALALHTSFREQVLLPAIRPSDRALLRSQAGPHAGAWLAAIPADPATTLAPDIMHLALRRRLRLPLPLTRARCGGERAPGCRALVDTRCGSKRSTTAFIYGAAARGEALCCDANLCHLSDAMAAPKRERLSGMGSQLRRHSATSWHVTPNSLAVASIAYVFSALRSGGAGTTNPSAWCSASLPARHGLTGMGKALVGCLGGCGPASDMQRCPRRLDNASAARSRKRRAAS